MSKANSVSYNKIKQRFRKYLNAEGEDEMTYEEFLKQAMNSIEKTHGKMIQDMKDYKKEKENPVIKKGLFSKLFNK